MNEKAVVILSDIIENTKGVTCDQKDNLIQVELVYDSLKKLGYEPIKLKFSHDTGYISSQLKLIKPEFVFNLVEEENNIIIAPMILDNLNIPYSGCTASTIYLTNDKLLFKEIFKNIFKEHNIMAPGYVTMNNYSYYNPCLKYIVKSIHHHSSMAINDDSVISTSTFKEIKKKLCENYRKYGKEFFAEEYIDGREFNVSILNSKVLPIAEILFENYPDNKVKIVGYKAKWKDKSFEFSHTTRNFNFNEDDAFLINNLKKISSICCNLFDLSGYARIDYRVNADGIPYLLEINANPCLSMDAGFYASCLQEGLNYNDMINEIINSIMPNKNIIEIQKNNEITVNLE